MSIGSGWVLRYRPKLGTRYWASGQNHWTVCPVGVNNRLSATKWLPAPIPSNSPPRRRSRSANSTTPINTLNNVPPPVARLPQLNGTLSACSTTLLGSTSMTFTRSGMNAPTRPTVMYWLVSQPYRHERTRHRLYAINTCASKSGIFPTPINPFLATKRSLECERLRAWLEAKRQYFTKPLS